MADYISNSSGNMTSAATWSLVDSTSFLNSETNTTTSTTSFVSSSTFVTGAITIDGIAVKVSAHTNPGSGTFSVRLFNTTLAAAVAGTTVTINVTDLPIVNTSTNNGFVFMKFTAPVLLLVANTYAVQVQSSVNATVTLYRDGTAANFSRMLRTTTTASPSTNDNTYVMGEYISAGSNNTFTVTMNNADGGATTFGASETSSKGVVAWGTAASTNYYLKRAGNLSIYTGGVYTIGTAAVPMPSTSTAKLEFANTSNVQFGIEVRLGGTFKTGGNVITNSAFLAADASAAATSLTTNVSTGWKSGDVIGIASTTQTRAESESKALTADASGTTLTITAITNAHSGTGAIAGELINLTRNVQIFGTSTSNQAYINIVSTSIVDMQSAEIYNMGSATALKRGIDVGTTTGSITINNCSIHDFIVASSIGIFFNIGSGNNYTCTNNVLYNIANIGISQTTTTGTSYTINNNIVMLTGATAISINDLTGTITNLTAISATGAGITFSYGAGANTEVFGTLSGFIAHSNSTIGVSFTTIFAVTNNPMGLFSNITSWRNLTSGVTLSNSFNFNINTITVFGNATANVTFGAVDCANIIINGITSNAGTTLTCPIGLNLTADLREIYIDNSTFGSTTTHATGDIDVPAIGVTPQIVLRNCIRSSTIKLANPGNMTEGGFVSSARDQQVSGSHTTTKKYGTILPDTTIFNFASPSVRLTPNNAAATNKLKGPVHKFAIANGSTATVSAYVRKSVAGDGTAYNGNQARIILLKDPAAGPSADTVLASTTNAANGAFEFISGTTVAAIDDAAYSVYVDCDGTTGWVNVDDWKIS